MGSGREPPAGQNRTCDTVFGVDSESGTQSPRQTEGGPARGMLGPSFNRTTVASRRTEMGPPGQGLTLWETSSRRKE